MIKSINMQNIAQLMVCFVTCSANAQYVAVTFNTPPAPTNLWADCYYQSTTNTHPPQVLFSVDAFNDYMSTNAASFAAWQTNAANPQVALNKNLARIVQLFNQIPAARTQMTNIQSSTINSVAAASTAIKASATVIDGILEELQRLGPVLKEIYKPESDNTK